MKRHPALLVLSREHQAALSLAQRAKRAAASGRESEVADLAAVVAHVFPRELAPHFRDEEDHLLPALEEAGEAGRVARTLADHQRLHALSRQLAEQPDAGTLAEFGALLADHVRFEERELFEIAQSVLDLSRLQSRGEHS